MGAGARMIKGFLYENSGWGDMTEINVAIVVGSSRREFNQLQARPCAREAGKGEARNEVCPA